MAYLKMEDLKEGYILYSEKENISVALINGIINFKEYKSSNHNDGGWSILQHMTHNRRLLSDDFEIIGDTRKLYLTKFGEVLVNDKVAFIFDKVGTFNDNDLAKDLMVAIENSTNVKWLDGNRPTRLPGGKFNAIYAEYSQLLYGDYEGDLFAKMLEKHVNSGHVVIDFNKNYAKIVEKR